jgi:hypothetical protein
MQDYAEIVRMDKSDLLCFVPESQRDWIFEKILFEQGEYNQSNQILIIVHAAACKHGWNGMLLQYVYISI